MEKILLDTDIGGDIDDAICLAYLLKEPQCELLGITTVCGEPEKRAAIADAIAEILSANFFLFFAIFPSPQIKKHLVPPGHSKNPSLH